VPPLTGHLVVDFTRYTPGAFAGRELLRHGARVVKVEPPEGDPMRAAAPAWQAQLDGGKESVVCDLKADPSLALALLARADVVLEGFRPGVAERLGIGPDVAPATAVYCSITGFGVDGPHASRAAHDVNYVGFAGLLDDTAPAMPPVQIADLAAGAYGAVTEILAALLERERTGRGARIVISMTQRSHELSEPAPRRLSGALACYRLYATADARFLTVGALEPKFFRRLCELVGAPELGERQFDADQEALAARLSEIFSGHSLETWLDLLGGEDTCIGPVATLAEAAGEFAPAPGPAAPPLGEHTERWRSELSL
jgi:alpha-methylacyl-CoA racemase